MVPCSLERPAETLRGAFKAPKRVTPSRPKTSSGGSELAGERPREQEGLTHRRVPPAERSEAVPVTFSQQQ
jgi:hypothetical protein